MPNVSISNEHPIPKLETIDMNLQEYRLIIYIPNKGNINIINPINRVPRQAEIYPSNPSPILNT